MTLRELSWVASGRRGFEGDLIGWLIKCIPAAIWAPKELPDELNPFREAKPESELMRRHRERWQERRWRVMSGG